MTVMRYGLPADKLWHLAAASPMMVPGLMRAAGSHCRPE
jgi:hypothetical protein